MPLGVGRGGARADGLKSRYQQQCAQTLFADGLDPSCPSKDPFGHGSIGQQWPTEPQRGLSTDALTLFVRFLSPPKVGVTGEQ